MSKKKVAIVGFAGTRDMAPFDDPECEIWSVNNLYKFIPRTDRIFQLHNPRLLTDEHHGVGGQEHLDDLKAATVPIYMQQHFDEIPYSVAYPLEEMTQEFGVPRPDGSGVDAYWTNSISFMIALAIHEGFEVIYIYGVDMAVGTEYVSQRPSCEYYIGIAKGRGIEVVIPVESDLLKTRFIYGYEEEKRLAWDLKLEKTIADMEKRRIQSDQVVRNQQSVTDKYEGAIAALREMYKTWQ